MSRPFPPVGSRINDRVAIHSHIDVLPSFILMTTQIVQNLKILVIGDLMIDHYIYGNCTRISPEAPVPVVEVTAEEYTLGGAGNVLKNLRAFGCYTNVFSVTGEDENAAIVKDQLALCNIDSNELISDHTRCTTIKSRVLANNHQLLRLDKEKVVPVGKNVEDAIIEQVRKRVKNYDVVLISDYEKGLLTNRLLSAIFKICKTSGIKSLVDPKGMNYSKYCGVGLIKPNKKEAGLATGIKIIDNATLELACIKIKEITGCEQVVITLSEEGIAFYDGKDIVTIPTKALDVIDVTGAGDTVLASLGVALASGHSLKDACVFANHAAAIVVSKVGSATATIDEINEKFPSP